MVLFTMAAGCVVVRWDIQKGKAIKRFEALRDVGATMDTVRYTELAPTRFKNFWRLH